MAAGKGFNKKCELSEDLADFMGKDKASRPEITKAIWAHIKKKGLQDESNRRIIHPDDDLSPILGRNPIDMMKMTKKVSEHIF